MELILFGLLIYWLCKRDKKKAEARGHKYSWLYGEIDPKEEKRRKETERRHREREQERERVRRRNENETSWIENLFGGSDTGSSRSRSSSSGKTWYERQAPNTQEALWRHYNNE